VCLETELDKHGKNNYNAYSANINSENNFNISCEVERIDDVGNDRENYI